jgi:hypothetical protein
MRSGQTAEIRTTTGHTVLVDAEDAWLQEFSWHVHRSGRNVYACTGLYGSDGRSYHVNLHNFMLPALPKASRIDVDHLNSDSLDNRRSNLRYLRHSENVRLGVQRRRIAIKAVA